jgi:hypothetical protein
MRPIAPQDHALAIAKPPLLALLTNAGANATGAPTRWRVPGAFAPREQLVDVLTCASVVADDAGGVDVVAQGEMPQVSFAD